MFRSWRARVRAWTVLASSTAGAVVAAGLLIAVIAFIDQRTNLSFGLLYLFPIILVGTVLPAGRWCSRHRCARGSPRCSTDSLCASGVAGTGHPGVRGVGRHRACRSRVDEKSTAEIEHVREVEREMSARRGAEEQLTFLINTSPAAIVTMNERGEVLLANAAANRLFGVATDQLPGQPISHYIPALGHVPSSAGASQTFQTDMQCRGERARTRSVFLANVFFSTYNTASGPRLAALIVDTSAELLEREESNLEQLLAGSRVLVAAVSHEVRNLCGAMGVIYENLVRSGRLEGDKDFHALGSLVDTLTRIACVELRQGAEAPRVAGVDLVEILEDLRIVLDPYCEDAGISVEWRYDIPSELPSVWADRHHLLQALLNLTKNSQRALRASNDKRISIAVSVHRRRVYSRDRHRTGTRERDSLFQPFQKGAHSTGLGLYLSRALLRSFRGDLRYDAAAPGCSFVIDLAVVKAREKRADQAGNPDDSRSSYESHPVVAG